MWTLIYQDLRHHMVNMLWTHEAQQTIRNLFFYQVNMNWWRQHRGLDSVASTRHIARLPAIVLKIIVVIRVHTTANQWKFVCVFFYRKLANSQEIFAVLHCKTRLMKKASVVYNFLAIWLVKMASAPLCGLLFTTAIQPIRKRETAELG